MTASLSRLARFESEAVQVWREAGPAARQPVMPFSAAKGFDGAGASGRARLPREQAGVPAAAARMRLRPAETPQVGRVRFRTLGCLPVTGATGLDDTDLAAVVRETPSATGSSERQRRISDFEYGGSLDHQKREGCF